MADKEFKWLIHSWVTVFLAPNTRVRLKGGIRIEAIP